MKHVQLQLNILSLGHHLPSVIIPKSLRDLLLDPKGEI